MQSIGATFLAACGVVSMSQSARVDSQDALLLVLGLCWLGFTKCNEWWHADPQPKQDEQAKA